MWKGKKVSVIFPTYNEKDSIKDAINDFFKYGYVDEIVVVNNNAAAGTSEEVKKTRAIEVFEIRQGPIAFVIDHLNDGQFVFFRASLRSRFASGGPLGRIRTDHESRHPPAQRFRRISPATGARVAAGRALRGAGRANLRLHQVLLLGREGVGEGRRGGD